MKTRIVREWPGGEAIGSADGTATEIAEGIWLSPGLSNSYLVQTAEGRVLINAGMGHEALVHKRCYDAVDDSPVRYILLTQGHVDHVGGVDQLRDEGTLVVAQAGNAACQADDARIAGFRMRRSYPFWKDAIDRAMETLSTPSPGGRPLTQATPTPDITFEDTWSMELGGIRFELFATPGGETTDSCVVWLPQRRIAFVGNLFSALFGHFPNLSTLRGDRLRDPLEFIRSCDRVLALEPSVLCVGHFGPAYGAEEIAAEITRVRDAVQHVHDQVVAGMNAGTDLHTLMREVRLPEHLEVGEGYGKVAWGVRAIWELYAGWFLAQSTTELYGVPARAAFPDIVAAAGADSLVSAAERAVAAGEPERALHLTDIVLEVDPGHPGAHGAALAAHQLLLERSERANLWETRWLELRIDEHGHGVACKGVGP